MKKIIVFKCITIINLVMMISDNFYGVEVQTNQLMNAEQTLFFWTMSQIKGQDYYYYKFLDAL